jgi:ankyrin repeat protein
MSPTNIHIAIENEHFPTVFNIIRRDKKCVHERDKWKQTPMHIAAKKGHLGIITLLYQSGGDVNARDQSAIMPLHRAAAEGCLNVVRFLIENGADIKINFKPYDGLSALHRAARYGYLPIVKYLVEMGADKNNRTWGGYTASEIAKIHRNIAIYQYLTQN